MITGIIILFLIIIIIIILSYYYIKKTKKRKLVENINKKIDKNIHKKLDAIFEQIFKMFKKHITDFLPQNYSSMGEAKKDMIDSINRSFSIFHSDSSEMKSSFMNQLNNYCETGNDEFLKKAISQQKKNYERYFEATYEEKGDSNIQVTPSKVQDIYTLVILNIDLILYIVKNNFCKDNAFMIDKLQESMIKVVEYFMSSNLDYNSLSESDKLFIKTPIIKILRITL